MTKRHRLVLLIGAAFSAAAVTGCAPIGPPADTQPATRATEGWVKSLPEAPILGNDPVARGVYVAVDRRSPLTGEALLKARLGRNQILETLRADLATVTTAPAVAAEDAEAPPQAVKFYLQGRQRFLEGNNTEAMAALEKALQQDPQSFTALRLMGRVCFAAAQLARGARYLESAHALRPDDVEVDYLLGRYWIERREYDKASYFLMRAADSPERQVTATFTPLSSFYLAIALQLGGYHQAATKEYEHFLELAALPVPGYRYDAELSYLINMTWAAHLAAAENAVRVGDYRGALPHYRSAAAARPDDLFIGSRYVTALVFDGQTGPAQKAALALTATRGGDESIRLLTWTYQAAGREGDLIADLSAHLQASVGTGLVTEQAAAVTLSTSQEALGRKVEALQTLAAFLTKHPKDLTVLGRLLKRVDTAHGFALGKRAAAAAIAADREGITEVLRLFMPPAEGPAGRLYANAAPADRLVLAPVEGGGAAFAEHYLEALTLQAQNVPPERVEAAFDAALRADGGFFPAVEAYVAYLLDQEKFGRATAVIEGLKKEHAGSARAWRLEVGVELSQQRYVPALRLAREARTRFPDDVDLRMQLATIYRLRGQDREADAELQGIIRDKPTHEAAYRTLVNALLARLRRPGPETNAHVATAVAALNGMARDLPDSRYGRVASAVLYARGGRYDDAETLLKSVLTSDPDEADALVPLSQILTVVGRTSEGRALLENAIRRKPQVEVVRALATMYRNEDRKADALSLVKRHAQSVPEAEGYVLFYATELATQEMRGEAVTVLKDACKRFPRSQNLAALLARYQSESDDFQGAVATMRDFMRENGETTERLYMLAHYYTQAGSEDASVAALQRVLTIMPDHVGANNDLGYFWINAGIRLEQAEPMIRKALDNKPDDPAFLDSLAWLYYKQGKFAEAGALLSKALAMPDGSAPEVVRHFGDTLFRLGRVPDAIEQWAKALQMINITERLSAAEQREKDYLTRAVSEAMAGRTPTVTPIVESVRAAGPAPAPAATMPQ